MTNGQLVKASIKSIDPPGEAIHFMFNPKEYTLSKSNNWQAATSSSSDSGAQNFGGGQGATLSLQLFFDTYLQRSGSIDSVEDVRVHTDKLWALLIIDEQTRNRKTDKGKPPEVLFQWGSTWFFKAVIKSMQQQFTLFMPNGMPVRATVTLELQQSEDKRLIPGEARAYRISEEYRRIGKNSNADLRGLHQGPRR